MSNHLWSFPVRADDTDQIRTECFRNARHHSGELHYNSSLTRHSEMLQTKTTRVPTSQWGKNVQNKPIHHRVGDRTRTDSSWVAHIVWISQILHIRRQFFSQSKGLDFLFLRISMDTVGKFGHFHQGTVGKEASCDLRLYFCEVQGVGSRVKPSKRWENVKRFFFFLISIRDNDRCPSREKRSGYQTWLNRWQKKGQAAFHRCPEQRGAAEESVAGPKVGKKNPLKSS